MAHGKFETPKKRRFPFHWLLLVLAIVSLSAGSVSAYLSMSSRPMSSQFSNASMPTVSVTGTTVTVTPNGYGVYLRVAVDASWEKDGAILAQEPSFTINGWREIDGFYYWPHLITESDTIEVPVSSSDSLEGYNLTYTVAAQIIQAVGQTDGDSPVDAVQDAWGVTKEDITG